MSGISLIAARPTYFHSLLIIPGSDNGVIVTSYLGSFLMAGAFLAIGSFVSTLTKNQVIAFIIASLICFRSR